MDNQDPTLKELQAGYEEQQRIIDQLLKQQQSTPGENSMIDEDLKKVITALAKSLTASTLQMVRLAEETIAFRKDFAAHSEKVDQLTTLIEQQSTIAQQQADNITRLLTVAEALLAELKAQRS
jgi:ABC-type transporter Mla subunit MlaD